MARFLEAIKSIPKGRFMVLGYRRPMKMRKGQPQLYKVWRGTVRPGVDYDNIGVVQEGRADGSLPAENAGLPYGEWLEFPYVIQHKGQFQYRFTKTGGKKLVSEIQDANGNVVSWDAAKEMALASEFPKADSVPSPILNVKEENIVELAGVPVEDMD